MALLAQLLRAPARALPSQVALDEIHQPFFHEHAILDASGLVTFVGKHEQLVVLPMLNQGVHEPRGVSEVHVLVNEAVHK